MTLNNTTARALRTLARVATSNAATANLGIPQRIELFTALAAVMPTQKERIAAERQAFLLREAEAHQLVFQELISAD